MSDLIYELKIPLRIRGAEFLESGKWFPDSVPLEHSEHWVQNNYFGSNTSPDIAGGLMHTAYIEETTGLILKAETDRIASFFDE